MAAQSTIELTSLRLTTDIGTYGPDDVVPDAHILDLTLTIAPELVLLAEEGMQHVFDYDPLVSHILSLASDGHYETQEWLMSRIARACATHREITGIGIHLYKHPVANGSGRLGVRLTLGEAELIELRDG